MRIQPVRYEATPHLACKSGTGRVRLPELIDGSSCSNLAERRHGSVDLFALPYLLPTTGARPAPAIARRETRRGAEKAWRDGYAYTKAGIMLDDLLPEDERPRTLFEEDTAKWDRLMGALDAINSKFGTWTAVTATQGFKREWKMRSEMRSPAWTTDIAQVPTVRA